MTPVAATIQPSDGIFKSSSRRIARPVDLPHSVLWLADDARQYEGLTSESNKSRPKMELCIRRNDGSIISTAEFSALQALVRRIVSVNLTPLAVPKDPAASSTQRTRKWYRKWYPQNYLEVLGRLEDGEPLLTLCGGSWKADQLVGRHLYWLAEQAKKEGRATGQKRAASNEGDSLDFDEEWGDLGNVDTSRKADGGPVQKRRKKMTMGKGKDKGESEVDSLTV
jgi:hypothetical protein